MLTNCHFYDNTIQSQVKLQNKNNGALVVHQFFQLSNEELSDIVGETVFRTRVCEKRNDRGYLLSSTCIINDKYVVKMPFDGGALRNIKQEIKISKVLKRYKLPFQTPRWRRVALKETWWTPSFIKRQLFCSVTPVISGKHPVSLNSVSLLSDLGHFFAKLHKIPAEKFAGVRTYMDVDFYYMIESWCKQDRLKGVRKNKWKRFKNDLIKSVLTPTNEVYIRTIRPVLTHADLHVGNVLVDENLHLTGVLDFGNAILTPEPQDVLVAERTIPSGRAMLNAYQGYMGQRLDIQDKLQKTWGLAAQMNVRAEQMLSEFLKSERQRG
ncbi:MAG: aminoglycoside phosphotransferase family protein [Alphaproteobacteria bacterium]|nr:aminoglycoside phosphotransferase family protein [Alphaproteobacteria bacterium]